jgi:hypothetical protein
MTAFRLALAGGTNEPPPPTEPKSAIIIRFPLERRRPVPDEATPAPEPPPRPAGQDDGAPALH